MASIVQSWRVDVTKLVNSLNREMRSVNLYYQNYDSFRDRVKDTDYSAPASLYIPTEVSSTEELEDRMVQLEDCVRQQAELIDTLQKMLLPRVKKDTEIDRELMI